MGNDGVRYCRQIAVSVDADYVPETGTGEVVKLALADGAETDRFPIGGRPSNVTVVSVVRERRCMSPTGRGERASKQKGTAVNASPR